jgi:hypothetical protein
VAKGNLSTSLALQELNTELTNIEWDMVVVDEVHHLLEAPMLYSLVEKLSRRCRDLLLLSALPARKREDELLRLLTLLEPDRYAEGTVTHRRFFELYEAQRVIGRRLNRLLGEINAAEQGEATSAEVLAMMQNLLGAPVLDTDQELQKFTVMAQNKPESTINAARSLHREVVDHYRINRRIFSQRYCGGWSANEQNRLRLLCEYWIHATNGDDAARELTRFLRPLKFPDFTERLRPPGPTPPQPPRPEPRPTPAPAQDERIEKLRANLEAWLGGGKLQNANDAQNLLWGFLKNALPLADYRISAARIREFAANRIDIIRIEDSATRSAFRNFFIDFPRNPETRDLILALAHFEYEGIHAATRARSVP